VRLFVAIVPPRVVLDELAAAVEPLRTAEPRLRWTTSDSWHLTLAFLGEVADRALPELSTRLGRAAGRHPAQLLAIAGAGAFPRPSRAQIVWAGVRADSTGLAALAASVAAGARRAGAPPPDEGRRYRPHVTLARSRDQADVTHVINSLGSFSTAEWSATRIALIHSRPGGSPRYDELGSWPLRPAAPAAPG
jgi:RNA 2',3'-cyclic 3'-phosphodiesterase